MFYQENRWFGTHMTYWYRAYGLVLRSEVMCPELPELANAGQEDITIRLVTEVEMAGGESDIHVADISRVARFRIENGREIFVQPAPEARPEDVRQYLYGVALTSSLYQRGDSPIHAGAVAIGARAHMFCGASGAGKSTLMMQLRRLGLNILCDDVGVIRKGPDDVVHFYHGVPRLKLWQDALTHFGVDNRQLRRDLVRSDKFQMPLECADFDSLPLGSIFSLVPNQDIDVPEIVPMSAMQVFKLLMSNTYRPRLLKRSGDPKAHTNQCIAAAQQAAGFEFRRPWNLQRLDWCADALVAQLADLSRSKG